MTVRQSGFRPLAPARNLTEQLAARLGEEIVSGKLLPNARLPTEQEMIAAFGVSRTVVREAIAALRAEGLVESRQGAGVFVARDARRRPFRIEPDALRTAADMVDVMDLRRGIAVEAAGLAAERRPAVAGRTVEQSLRAFRKAVENGEPCRVADEDFHQAIAEAAGNPHFAPLLRYLSRLIEPHPALRGDEETAAQHRAYLAAVLNAYQIIHAAIAKGDATAARRAMRNHLVQAGERLRELAAGQELA